jgi:hypothetical protein
VSGIPFSHILEISDTFVTPPFSSTCDSQAVPFEILFQLPIH